MSDYYLIKVEPVDENSTQLLDDHGRISRQGYRVLNLIEQYGYNVKIERPESEPAPEIPA